MTEKMTRRGFLAAVGRGAAFGGLGAIVARLAGRAAPTDSSSQDAELCERCPVLGCCALPVGVRVRRARGLGERKAQDIPRGDADLSGGRALCGARRPESPGSRWITREMT